MLNRSNFAGCWQGPGIWFGRDGSDRLDLTSPQRVIDPTTYVIRFSDADHGVWDGSGLAFAPGGLPFLFTTAQIERSKEPVRAAPSALAGSESGLYVPRAQSTMRPAVHHLPPAGVTVHCLRRLL